MHLTKIWTYPIKGLSPIEVEDILITPLGLELDRKWVLVDDQNRFLSQRDIPALTLFKVARDDQRIIVEYENSTISWLIDDTDHSSLRVSIWKDDIESSGISPLVNEWFSEILERTVRLARMNDPSKGRIKHVTQYPSDFPLSFVDGYPVHIINQSSLDDLSARIGESISPLRFRPNMIIEGLPAYEEENLQTLEGGDWALHFIKPTVRCQVPNVDPDTAQRGKEPISTLSGFKRKSNNIEFGMYAVVKHSGHLRLNQKLRSPLSS